LWNTVPYWPHGLLWWRWIKRVGFIIMIILSPEIGVAIAMGQHLFARESQEGRDLDGKEIANEEETVGGDGEKRGISKGKVVEEGPRQIEDEEINVEKREEAIYQILQKEGFVFTISSHRLMSYPKV
jgi:hypothetical protein